MRYGRGMDMDLKHLIQDKYAGDESSVTEEDHARLLRGEPLAYVIGWIPFLGLHIGLDTHPLIPRSETEWWTEKLIAHLTDSYGEAPFTFLDLCAGSGAIGLSILKHFPHARVSFGDIIPAHAGLIARNIERNGLDAARADIRTGDVFTPFEGMVFDVIGTNPPYIPHDRVLDTSVTNFEPSTALFAGPDGLDVIRVIASGAGAHSHTGSELWMETDSGNSEAAAQLLASGGAREALIQSDLYDRPRLVIAYY